MRLMSANDDGPVAAPTVAPRIRNASSEAPDHATACDGAIPREHPRAGRTRTREIRHRAGGQRLRRKQVFEFAVAKIGSDHHALAETVRGDDGTGRINFQIQRQRRTGRTLAQRELINRRRRQHGDLVTGEINGGQPRACRRIER
jgi:hypothetical protein